MPKRRIVIEVADYIGDEELQDSMEAIHGIGFDDHYVEHDDGTKVPFVRAAGGQ